ncbi:methylmalonyl-CoA mutase [Flavobacterium sp. MAH-1]|uniref:Methylmalonyl-CoA mutase n=1 Tax=Flavobacterium agri TaxID=2743471 RepID=A0A7Y9C741_9FLAO|nr:methylmalonyl-CoA mutase subunit beta [Flavobacterium agri]NUY81019.1 methylmalonyl-CoA mutase [Flavobacterium agri]NYA71043.1 methylmalonyl-CoA mutase [Flavobacterium agri]
MSTTSDNLFEGFEGVSSKQWKQQIQYELKGADFNETLVWESPEGIKVRPFYHADEDAISLPASASHPFLVCQEIFVFDVEKSIRRANDSMSRGAESLRFVVSDEKADVTQLINGLAFENATLYFDLKFLSIDFVKRLDSALNGKSFVVFCSIDPIGNLVSDGNWFGKKDDFEDLAKLSTQTKNLSVHAIDARLYQNSGANIVQQLTYTLAHATEYFNRMPIDKTILVQISIGPNYFFEIAKVRALRILLASVMKEFGIVSDIHILATPTKRNKTLYDYNVNMLRTTTECMSAVLGGADSVCNLPYDALYHKSNEFGERISRNQLLILKSESYFDKVENAADGAYYIENLTQQLASQALMLFKEIEADGGFLAQLKDGTIQRKVKEAAEKEQALFDSGKEILIGTNKYPNKNDRMKDDLELYPFIKKKARKTLFTPLVEKRLAERLEQERLESENELK